MKNVKFEDYGYAEQNFIETLQVCLSESSISNCRYLAQKFITIKPKAKYRYQAAASCISFTFLYDDNKKVAYFFKVYLLPYTISNFHLGS